MAPVVHGLEDRYGDRVRFVYLDIDDPRTKPFKQQLNYRYQPHIFLLDNDGHVLAQWVGAVDAATLEQAIVQAIQ